MANNVVRARNQKIVS